MEMNSFFHRSSIVFSKLLIVGIICAWLNLQYDQMGKGKRDRSAITGNYVNLHHVLSRNDTKRPWHSQIIELSSQLIKY